MNEINASARKGDIAKNRIIEAAYLLFIQQGYHKTSMRQIVERCGLTMGGIYNHFENKEAIWQTVLIQKHPYHEIIPLMLSAESDTIAAFVRQTASRMVNELSKRKDLLNLMFIELVEFDGRHIRALFDAILPEIMKVSSVMNSKTGKLRPIPPPVLARSFFGLFISYYITEILIPDELRHFAGENALETFIDIYLHGILDGAQGSPE